MPTDRRRKKRGRGKPNKLVACWQYVGPIARTFLIALVVTFVVSKLDILGLDSNLGAVSDAISARLRSVDTRFSPGQKKVTVVLIDQAYIQGRSGEGPGWPLPGNNFLLNILEPIVHAKPRAIFIDISFTDQPRAWNIPGQIDPDAAAKLGAGIRELSRGVPIFVGDKVQVSRERGCEEGWTDLESLSGSGTTSKKFITALSSSETSSGKADPPKFGVVAANWIGPSSEYPVGTMLASRPASCTEVRNTAHQYFSPNPPKSAQGGYLLSPAATLLLEFCPDSKRRACDDFRLIKAAESNQGYALHALSPELESRMAVSWKTAMSDYMRDRSARSAGSDACERQMSRSWIDGLINGAAQTFRAFVPSLASLFGEGYFDMPCYAIDTIAAEEVRRSGLWNPDDPKLETFNDLIKGRAVLIGTQIPAVPDLVQTPLGVQMPGVFLHAMALENMLDAEKSIVTHHHGFSKFWGELAEALIVASVATFASWSGRKWHLSALLQRQSYSTRIVQFSFVLVGASLFVFLIATAWLLAFPFTGNPIFVAIAVIAILTEDLRRHYFSESHVEKPAR